VVPIISVAACNMASFAYYMDLDIFGRLPAQVPSSFSLIFPLFSHPPKRVIALTSHRHHRDQELIDLTLSDDDGDRGRLPQTLSNLFALVAQTNKLPHDLPQSHRGLMFFIQKETRTGTDYTTTMLLLLVLRQR